MAGEHVLDPSGQARPSRGVLRPRHGRRVVQREAVAGLQLLEFGAPGEVVVVADAVEQVDVALLAAGAQRLDHAHERREAGAGGDEQAGPRVVLQQELALGPLQVDRVAEAALPEERREGTLGDEADEEFVLGQVVGR